MGTPLFMGDVFQWARFCSALSGFCPYNNRYLYSSRLKEIERNVVKVKRKLRTGLVINLALIVICPLHGILPLSVV